MTNDQLYSRIFLALVPPEDINEQLQQQIHSLKYVSDLMDVKWYAPEKLHITLQFLGEMPFNQLHELSAQLTLALKHQAPLTIALGDTVVFPSLRHPKVIAVEVMHTPELLTLITTIHDITQKCGLSAPDFPFNGHLTLGRWPHKFGNFTSKIIMPNSTNIAWQAEEWCLMESVIEHGSSHYVVLLKKRFGG